MSRTRRIALLAIGLAVGCVLLAVWNSDARRIERRLAELRKLAAKSPIETQLQGAGKARRIVGLFASDFELIAEPESFATSNRQDLTRGIIAYRSRSRSLLVDVLRHELIVDPGGTTAAHFGYVQFVTNLGDVVGTATYPVKIEWLKEDGDWLIKKLEVFEEEAR